MVKKKAKKMNNVSSRVEPTVENRAPVYSCPHFYVFTVQTVNAPFKLHSNKVAAFSHILSGLILFIFACLALER